MNMIEKDSLKAADRAAHLGGGYVSPEVNVILFQPEGVLCASVGGDHEGFEPGGEYEID